MSSETPHGTYGRYQQHKRDGEDACEACKQANRDYIREYRYRNPHVHEQVAAHSRAWNRAARRLVELHKDEFRRLYAQEKVLASE